MSRTFHNATWKQPDARTDERCYLLIGPPLGDGLPGFIYAEVWLPVELRADAHWRCHVLAEFDETFCLNRECAQRSAEHTLTGKWEHLKRLFQETS